MHAPEKDSSIPTINAEKLAEYDVRSLSATHFLCQSFVGDISLTSLPQAFLLGIPTRYGNFPAQWKTFWDTTGKQWASGGYWGKYAGLFLSTASMGGGQESTALASMSTLSHHGIIYVPFGYAKAFGELTALDELRGGGPWGAGTIAGGSGERQPSERELFLAKTQGKAFWETVSKVSF